MTPIRSLLFAAILIPAALPASVAWSQSAKTREQVKAETRSAVSEGKAPVGQDGLTPAEREPSVYASGAARTSKARTAKPPKKKASAA